jgi:hypothetical protein
MSCFNVLRGEAKFLSPEIKKAMIELLEEWAKHFPKEDTWVWRNYSVPTLIARVDFVISEDGKIIVIEIEDRPAGLGAACDINPEFAERLRRIQEENWLPFYPFVPPNKEHHPQYDDYRWLGSEPADQEDCLLLIRADRDETSLSHLIWRSVSTVRTEGDKGYGEKMGFWGRVSLNDLDENSSWWLKGFCLKGLRDSCAEKILIWHPELSKNKHKIRGISTKGKIIDTLSTLGEMFIQEFIPPLEMEYDGKKFFGIHRFHFGFDIVTKKWVPLGGYMCFRERQLLIFLDPNGPVIPLN